MAKLSWGYHIIDQQGTSVILGISTLRYYYEILKIILCDLQIYITFKK